MKITAVYKIANSNPCKLRFVVVDFPVNIRHSDKDYTNIVNLDIELSNKGHIFDTNNHRFNIVSARLANTQHHEWVNEIESLQVIHSCIQLVSSYINDNTQLIKEILEKI